MTATRTYDEAVANFWTHVDVGDCWEWTGSLAGGYGHLRWAGRYYRAHRFAWEALVGPIAPGLKLDHLCRNTRCVNPDHLEPVTQRVNLMRAPLGASERARRTHCPRGHEYTPENTYVSKRNQRTCKQCSREFDRRRRPARRAA